MGDYLLRLIDAGGGNTSHSCLHFEHSLPVYIKETIIIESHLGQTIPPLGEDVGDVRW